MTTHMKAFWLVWNPERNAPRVKHEHRSLAVAEAERLARMNPGETFIVLETVTARCVENMQRIDMRPGDVEEVPF